MKAGLTSSVVLHSALLVFGLVSLGAPKPHEVTDVEALPVDIVPVEEVAKMLKGDRDSQDVGKPAPKPTTRAPSVPDAQNVGDNDVDLNDVPKPQPKPRAIETASAPKAEPEPLPKPEPVKPEPKPEPVAQPAPPKPEPKPEPVAQPKPPEPAPAPTPDPVAEAIAEAPKDDSVALPEEIERPAAKPERKPQQVASAEQPKKKPEPPKERAKAPSQEQDLDSVLNEAKALLTKEAPAGGGARRSDQTAAIGNTRSNNLATLSQSEKGLLSAQLASCWSIPAGNVDGEGLRVTVQFTVDMSGKLSGRPEVTTSSGNRPFDESAVRAVQKCDRQGLNLPSKQDQWDVFVVNFDPAEMF